MESARYYIVDADVLPEVFLKVARAKELLGTGAVSTVAEASALTGVSRSAYYKYQGAIRPFFDLREGRIVTFQMVLCDRTGVLSSVLAVFAHCAVNILTIHQSVPTGGTAVVTISAGTERMLSGVEELLTRVRELDGVVRIEISAA